MAKDQEDQTKADSVLVSDQNECLVPVSEPVPKLKLS